MMRLLFLLCLVAPVALAQVSPHGTMKIECRACHTTESWEMRKDATFDHNKTGFPLAGQHKTIPCASCHAGLKFEATSSSCASCHEDIHRGELGEMCARCHSPQSWKVTDMLQRHQETRFPLLGRHTGAECQACHERASEQRFAGTPTTCIGCHREAYQTSRNPGHVAAGFPADCERCHQVTAQTWSQGFDHTLTAFPLTGAHTATPCLECHRDQTFSSTPAECYACHREDYERTQNPNHVAANFPTECQTCHNTASWEEGLFDHNQTLFPLTGAHQQQSCAGCHADNVYAGRPSECMACHATQFNQTQNPNHVTAGFPQQCEMCHTTMTWSGATFDHNATNFGLTGAHTTTQCQACHINNNYQLTYENCYQCHQDDFTIPADPNHVTGNFNHDCQPCHTTASWLPSTFSHNTTLFPLTGAHQAVSCSNCHVNNQYQGLPTDCYGCHEGDFNATTNPSHLTGNFSHDCTLCHATTGWSPASFDHATTNFPLTGSHTTAQCQSCHVNGNYQLVYTDCYPCHQDDFALPINPNHVAGNFNHDCSPCHSTTAWLPSTFSHNNTAFPLTGAHQAVNCSSCHINNQYQGLPTDCYGCHENDFNGTTNPNHVAGNFNHDCTQCHTTTAWSPASFDHNQTNFPLTGSHATATCQSCHINGNYQLTYEDCYQCHQAQFQIPTNPNHVAGNFNHDCSPCHTTTAWLPSTFSHNNTAFPLTGAHQAVSCSNCHINNQYQGLPTDCYGCHDDDFNGTTNPNHVAGSFSHDCTQCHTTAAWSPATFDHGQTNFPLTGSHVTASCQSCHINGNYQLTYEDCYQCHQAQFQIPTNPNHVQLQFSHDCTPCHTTTAWLPSTFNHDQQYFRIYSGRHEGRWNSCFDCHPTPGNFTDFTCTTCHERERMDDKHREVTGYVYSSPACYSCHRFE